jgi:hypothetical protein
MSTGGRQTAGMTARARVISRFHLIEPVRESDPWTGTGAPRRTITLAVATKLGR